MYPFSYHLGNASYQCSEWTVRQCSQKGKIVSEIDNDSKKTEQHNGFACEQGWNRSTVTDWSRQWVCPVVRLPETSLWQIYTNCLTVVIFCCDSVPFISYSYIRVLQYWICLRVDLLCMLGLPTFHMLPTPLSPNGQVVIANIVILRGSPWVVPSIEITLPSTDRCTSLQ